jgi:hypothetical protein
MKYSPIFSKEGDNMFKHCYDYRTRVIVFAFIMAGLLGCASPAAQKAMVVENVSAAKKHPFSVSVAAQGGSETGPFDVPGISNENFAKAIEESIIKTGTFNNIVNTQGADYELGVVIVEIGKPMMGFDMTVDMEASWSLVRAQSRDIVLRKSIKSSNTATVREELGGASRLRLALERAARENIRIGLIEIGRLDLR